MAVETRETEAVVEPVVQQGLRPESKRPMSLGLMLPIAEQNAVSNDSPVDSFWDTVAMARLAIEIGFDMLWLPDHFMLKLERHGGQARGVWECWTTTAVSRPRCPEYHRHHGGMSFHNPGSIAKMAETIDEISRGNFVLGVGCGGTPTSTTCTGSPTITASIVSRKRCGSSRHWCVQGTPTSTVSTTERAKRSIPARPRWREGGPPSCRRQQATHDAPHRALRRRLERGLARQCGDRRRAHEAARRGVPEVGRSPRAWSAPVAVSSPWQGARIAGIPSAAVSTRWPRPCTRPGVGLVHYLCAPDPCTLQTLQDFAKVIEAYDRG